MFPYFTRISYDHITEMEVDTTTDTTKFRYWYDYMIQSIKSQRMRVVSIGIEEAADPITSLFFSDDLPGNGNDNSHLNCVLANVREIIQENLHRSDIEPTGGNGGLDFVAFSCMHTPMRPSGKRVVNEI